MKKWPMQDWAHQSIEDELEELKRNSVYVLDSQGMELVYACINGRWTFYVRRKKKTTLADDVEEKMRVWSSGLVLNLVDFAIAMENLLEFLQELREAKPNSFSGFGAGSTPKLHGGPAGGM